MVVSLFHDGPKSRQSDADPQTLVEPRAVGTTWRFSRIDPRTSLTITFATIAVLASFFAYHVGTSREARRKEMLSQAYLIDAENRAALTREVLSIVDGIAVERTQFNATSEDVDSMPSSSGASEFALSPWLHQRVIAVSNALAPYRPLDRSTDTVEARLRSPERGHLLRLLVGAEVAPSREFNFESAYLPGADFHRANLPDVRLANATLTGADFSYANLLRATLTSADLSKATLSHANLREADLQEADLNQASLLDVNLSLANLQGANLAAAQLEHTSLRGADLRGANLTGALLGKCNLIGADLREADLRGADIRSSDLRHANLAGVAVFPDDWNRWVKAHARWSEAGAWHLIQTSGEYRLALAGGWKYETRRLRREPVPGDASASRDAAP